MAIINFFIQDWLDFAEKHNGVVKQTKTGLSPVGFGMSVWKKVYLKIPYLNSDIVFMTGEATRMEIFYNFQDDLHLNFLIYPEDNMDKIGKFFNLIKEIRLNDELFDKKYFIKSDNENLIKTVLSDDIKDFLVLNRTYVSNFKLDLKNGYTVLELNAPFNENNEAVQKSVSKRINNINFDIWKNKKEKSDRD
jgi:hypothetical protein